MLLHHWRKIEDSLNASSQGGASAPPPTHCTSSTSPVCNNTQITWPGYAGGATYTNKKQLDFIAYSNISVCGLLNEENAAYYRRELDVTDPW
jgi:hypothetical protein